MEWIGYFIVALAISLAMAVFIAWLACNSSKKFLVRFGGIAMAGSFLVCLSLNPELVKTPQILALLIGVFFILVLGVIDDIKNLDWKIQLVFQIGLVALLVVGGFSIDYVAGIGGQMIRLDQWSIQLFGLSFQFLSLAIILLWVMGVMNAINWADGIDGLAGGIGMVGALALFWISLSKEVNQPAVAIIAIIFLASVLGFWWLNFPKARIEAGTSGSYFIGFVLAAMAIMAGTKIATAMIVLAIPMVDLVWVIVQRATNKVPIIKKDLGHLHHKLCQIGWSNTRIVNSYLSFIAMMLVLANFANTRAQKFAIIALELVLVTIFVHLVTKKQKNLKLTQV